MIKVKKILKAVFFSALLVLLLTGCTGSNVDTTLNINKDLTGKRVIEMTVTQSNIEEYVQGTEADIEECLSSALPEDLTYTTKKQDDKVIFHFELSFDSVADYEKKVEKIADKDVNISISISDSVWTSGIFVEENFESKDLLEWFKQALVDDELISESNANSLFGGGNTQVVYGDETYSCSSFIRVDETVTQGIDAIDVLTSINSLDNYDRKIIFKVPESSMTGNGEKIREYMNDLAKPGVVFEESKDESVTLFSYEAKGLNVQKMDAFMKSIFGQDNVSVSPEEPEGVDNSAFSFYSLMVENIKFTDFIVGNATTHCNYYVALSDEYKVCNTKAVGFDTYAYESDYYKGYTELINNFYVSSDSVLELNFMVKRSLIVDSLKIFTERNGSKWKRQVEIGFEDAINEADRGQVIEKINAKYQNGITELKDSDESLTDEDFAAVDINGNEKDGIWKLTIEQKGTGKQMNNSTYAIYGTYGKMDYGYDHGVFKVKKNVCYIENLDLSQFLGNVGEDFESYYKLKTGLLTSFVYAETNTGDFNHKGNSFEVNDFGTSLYIKYLGTEVDIFAALFIGFLVLSVLLIVIAVLKSGIISSKKNDKGQKDKVKDKLLCSKCGKELSEIAKFCPRCGESTVQK